MCQRDLIPFLAIAFLIAWGVLALYIFASQTMVRLSYDPNRRHNAGHDPMLVFTSSFFRTNKTALHRQGRKRGQRSSDLPPVFPAG